jgi:hypothetical protein
MRVDGRVPGARRLGFLLLAATMATLSTVACGGDGIGVEGTVQFTDDRVDFGDTDKQGVVAGQVVYQNGNIETLLNISFRGDGVPEGVSLLMLPGFWGRIKSGRRLSSALQITAGGLPPGPYSFGILLLVDGLEEDRLEVTFDRAPKT